MSGGLIDHIIDRAGAATDAFEMSIDNSLRRVTCICTANGTVI